MQRRRRLRANAPFLLRPSSSHWIFVRQCESQRAARVHIYFATERATRAPIKKHEHLLPMRWLESHHSSIISPPVSVCFLLHYKIHVCALMGIKWATQHLSLLLLLWFNQGLITDLIYTGSPQLRKYILRLQHDEIITLSCVLLRLLRAIQFKLDAQRRQKDNGILTKATRLQQSHSRARDGNTNSLILIPSAKSSWLFWKFHSVRDMCWSGIINRKIFVVC